MRGCMQFSHRVPPLPTHHLSTTTTTEFGAAGRFVFKCGAAPHVALPTVFLVSWTAGVSSAL